ncbi:MAG: uvrY [Gammaproteobacteria bacterium]|jgi:two-component system invasion response regulator UvrY|nr:uvrY [Gammaproteobacteria bacterium]MCE3237701.1 uvrY [Gammaproteobacteria bacterium]
MLIRAAIARLLADIPGFKVIGNASTDEEGVRLAKELMPNVVLMNIRPPFIDALEATNRMTRHNPDIKILIVTARTDEPYPSRLLQAGVAGYITKSCTTDEMIHAIRTVHAGQRYLSRDIAQQLALKNSIKAGESELDKLSLRELQVMLMIIDGKNIQEISEKLCISPKTAHGYRYRILNLLNISSDVGLTLWAIRLGIIKEHRLQTNQM